MITLLHGTNGMPFKHFSHQDIIKKWVLMTFSLLEKVMPEFMPQCWLQLLINRTHCAYNLKIAHKLTWEVFLLEMELMMLPHYLNQLSSSNIDINYLTPILKTCGKDLVMMKNQLDANLHKIWSTN